MSELSDLTLNYSLRDKTGTSSSKQLRSQGRIPAVLYGKEMNRALSVDDKDAYTSQKSCWYIFFDEAHWREWRRRIGFDQGITGR